VYREWQVILRVFREPREFKAFRAKQYKVYREWQVMLRVYKVYRVFREPREFKGYKV
jgi:hypothetical protein